MACPKKGGQYSSAIDNTAALIVGIRLCFNVDAASREFFEVFFFLSKTLGVILMPSNLMIGVGIVGLMFWFSSLAALGRKLVVASVLLMAICGFSPIGNWLLYPLEARFPQWKETGRAPDGVIVLGGAIDPNMSALHDVIVFGASVDRIVAAAALARRYPTARVVFSGGNANLIRNDDSREADLSVSFFESFGISRDRMILERRSRNTYENAEFVKDMVSPKRGERWILVTSAYHMPRSIGIFRKIGFEVEPYPVDWRTAGRSSLPMFSEFLIVGLSRVDTACREWMGLAAYWITGKTSEFFPGPG
jgi:uncharacterized SAM-binding protein YcdF (DUF218 family)